MEQIYNFIGKLIFYYLTLRILIFLLLEIKKKIFPKNLLKRYGENSWALVTGGSDGIGKSFCFELAANKFNIIIIARNEEKLKRVSEEIRNKYKVETKIIVADFKNSNEEKFFDKIEENIKDLDVSLLINNVAIEIMEHFNLIDENFLKNMVIINCIPAVILSSKLIKKFLKRDKKSGIINVSSISGLRPMPFLNVYSASKAFMDSFSHSVGYEYKSYNNINIRIIKFLSRILFKIIIKKILI